ncbi:acetyl-CoA synthetase-like protein, partial [Myriangium duriaei CBS 260.36]
MIFSKPMQGTVRTVIRSEQQINPCHEDLVTFTIGHNNYDPSKLVLHDAALHSHAGYSLHGVRKNVRQCIEALHRVGVTPGDTVCLAIHNCAFFPICYLAVVGLGAMITAANPVYTASELAHHFKTSKASLVVTESSVFETAKRAACHVGLKEDRVVLKDMLEDLLPTCSERDWIRFDDFGTSKNTIACLNSTSGTTGLPKMAARSHYSLVMENIAIQGSVAPPYEPRRLLSAPLFHGFSAPIAIINPLRFGHPTYIMSGYNQNAFLTLVEQYKITETAMPPPMLSRFLAMDPKDRVGLENIRRIWSGGAPMSAEFQKRATEMFANDANICQVWGMTEGGWMTTSHQNQNDCSGSVGRLLGTYEVMCVVRDEEQETDESSKESVGDNDPSYSARRCHDEIWIRGPINMVSYFDNPKATAEIFTEDGWLKTGDVGYASADGRLFIVDRAKELIKVRAWQVAPAEIEARLLSHPLVADAGVVGVPVSGEASEVPYAFVVPKVTTSQTFLTADEVKAYLLLGLAKYKVRDCRIRFTKVIPKSASGKILRNQLRAIAASE